MLSARVKLALCAAAAVAAAELAAPTGVSAKPSYSAGPSVALIDRLALKCIRVGTNTDEVRLTRTKDDASSVNGYDGRGYEVSAADRANGEQYANQYSVNFIQRRAGGKWEGDVGEFFVRIDNGVLDFQGKYPNLCHYRVNMASGASSIEVVEERKRGPVGWGPPKIIQPPADDPIRDASTANR